MKINRKLIDPVIIILLCFVMMIPFFRNGVLYTGVDMAFHLNRAFEQYRVIQDGHVFSLINTYSLNHLGAPVNMLYGFIYLYPLAFWMLVVHNKVLAVYLGISTILACVALFSYWIGNKYWLNKRDRALAFAVLFTFSTYIFGILFGTFDLAQTSATAFLPGVAYGTYSIFWRNKREWPFLALGMAGTIYCHLVSTLIYSTLVLTIIIVALLCKKVNMSKIVALLKAVVMTIFTTSFFWINFLIVYLNNPSINIPNSGNISGNTPADFTNLLLTMILGIVITVLFIITLLNWQKLNNQIKVIGILSLFYMFMSIDISNFIWHFLNKTPVKQIQGVFRFRAVILLLVLVFIISAVSVIFSRENYTLYSVIVLVCCSWLSSSYTFFNDRSNFTGVTNYYAKYQESPFSNYKISNNQDFMNTVDEVYVGVGCLDYWPSSALVRSGSLMRDSASQSKPQFNGVKFNIFSSTSNKKIALPFLIYKGITYKVTNNGHIVDSKISKYGCLSLRLNKGKNNIRIKARLSSPQIVCIVISLLSLIIIFILLI